MFTTPRILLPALALAALLLSPAVSQGVPIHLDFSDSSQYTDNFRQIRNTGSQMSWSSAVGPDGQPGIISGAHSSTVSQFRYDTDPTNNVTRDVFLTETVSADLRFNQFGAASHGMFLRVQDSNLGILGLVSYGSSSSEVRIRLSYGAELTSGGSGLGTVFWDATFNLSNGDIDNAIGTGGINGMTNTAANQWLHFEFQQTADDFFNLSVYRGENLVASTGLVELVAMGAHTETNIAQYRNAGSVGFRINNGSGSTVTSAIDNFSIIPEPATLALLAAGGLLMVSRRRA